MRTFHRIKKEIGLQVLFKFNSKCTTCGSDHDICVHHIQKMDVLNPEYNNIDNLTLLCRKCHMSHHRKQGDIKPLPDHNGCFNSNGRRGNNPPVQCMVEGCEKMQHGRALCKNHYEQRRRKGF